MTGGAVCLNTLPPRSSTKWLRVMTLAEGDGQGRARKLLLTYRCPVLATTLSPRCQPLAVPDLIGGADSPTRERPEAASLVCGSGLQDPNRLWPLCVEPDRLSVDVGSPVSERSRPATEISPCIVLGPRNDYRVRSDLGRRYNALVFSR
jgi:hypothetical protein